jgi:phosphatidylglycerol:prolipoprotein diacylglycerol transferase
MHPVLFTIPGLESDVQAYGLLMGLALLVGWWLTLRFARADRLPAERIGTIYVVSVIVAVLCGRALWLVQQPTAFDPASILSLKAGGSSIIGALMAGLVVSGVMCSRAKIPWFAVMDCAAPAFMVGVIIERIGALLAGADFGAYVGPREFGYSLHVVYPEGSPVYRFHQGLLDGMRGLPELTSAPVHPVQLYAAGLALLGVALALFLRRRRRFSGQVFFGVMALYVVARMVIEDPLRYDASDPAAYGLRMGQISALGLLLVLFAAYQQRAARAAKDLDDGGAGLRQWLGGPWSDESGAET